jgi:hypothetical protein
VKKIVIVIILSIITSASTCKRFNGWDSRLAINNKSSQPIYYAIGNGYPDTLIPGYPPLPNPALSPSDHEVMPFSMHGIALNGTWESFYSDIYPSDKLVFFVFDANTLETTNWDTVRARYRILKRYDLTLDSIRKMNWVLTYP